MTTEWRSKGNVGGDVFIKEPDSPEYGREEVTIENEGDTVIEYAAGYPFVYATDTPVVAADIANTTALLAETQRLEPGEVRRCAVVARGNVVINRDALPTADVAAAAYNMTNFQTAIEALGFVVRREPAEQAEQTT